MHCYQLTTGTFFKKKTAACWLCHFSSAPCLPGRNNPLQSAQPAPALLLPQATSSTCRAAGGIPSPPLLLGMLGVWFQLHWPGAEVKSSLFVAVFQLLSHSLLQQLRMDTGQAWDPLTPHELLTIFISYRTRRSNEQAQHLRHHWKYLQLLPKSSQGLTKWKWWCYQKQAGSDPRFIGSRSNIPEHIFV